MRGLHGILLRMVLFFMRSRQRFSDMYGQGCQGEAGLFLLIHACKLHTYAHKPGVRLFKVCVVCLLAGNFERSARGRLVCLSAVCPLVNNPRGRFCLFLIMHTHTNMRTHSHNVVCLLVTSREVPGEGLSVLAQSAPW